MLSKVTTSICLASALMSGTAIAATSSTSPVAYVYLASSVNNGNEHILGYTASADGHLTPIPGSPFYALVQYLAVNGKYLFASSAPGLTSQNPAYLYSYLIEPNGALKYVGATNTETNSENRCNVPYNLDFDHTGSDLYVYASYVGCTVNPENAYQSFSVNKYTGALQDLYTSIPSASVTSPLVISANNKFAYAFQGTGYMAYGRTPHAYQRQSGGELMDIAVDLPSPAGDPPNFQGLFHAGAATDASDHMAVFEIYFLSNGGGANRIATYTINPDTGALSTSSTFTNMPASLVASNVTMRFSPSGSLLAVGGSGGLQIFSSNGAAQEKPLTGLIIKNDFITQLYWDNANHLYALGVNSGLHVFTVTATGATEAPGSPYNVQAAISLIVQPK